MYGVKGRVQLSRYTIDVELTATKRTGFHRYTYPLPATPGVVLDLQHRDKVLASGLKILGDREIEGYRFSTAWAKEQRLYFVIRFSRPFKEAVIESEWNFEQVLNDCRMAWISELEKVTVDGGNPDQRVVFYTALYHALLSPNLYMDVDGKYLGRDLQVHQADSFDYYTVFSLWDTYRALHPLLTILDQKRTNDFI